MLGLYGDREYHEYLFKCENPYIELQQLMSEVRRRAKDTEYQFRDSQILTWVVQGINPTKLSHTPKNVKVNRYMEELLLYVDDKEVRDAVKSSYQASKATRNLIYNYQSIQDEPRKARVRVLLRMIWYNN